MRKLKYKREAFKTDEGVLKAKVTVVWVVLIKSVRPHDIPSESAVFSLVCKKLNLRPHDIPSFWRT